MSGDTIPEEDSPITPMEYWMESMAAWHDFGQQANALWMERAAKKRPVTGAEADPADDTVTTDILRMMSSNNLRHWQNTARLLAGLPAWMRAPQMTNGSAFVDWFDRLRRGQSAFYPGFNTVDAAPYDLAPNSTLQETNKRPEGLPAPEGTADDLTKIKGIGPKLSAKLNALGIYHFRQIAHWNENEALWIDDHLSFKGRVDREKWIPQARGLSANGSTRLH